MSDRTGLLCIYPASVCVSPQARQNDGSPFSFRLSKASGVHHSSTPQLKPQNTLPSRISPCVRRPFMVFTHRQWFPPLAGSRRRRSTRSMRSPRSHIPRSLPPVRTCPASSLQCVLSMSAFSCLCLSPHQIMAQCCENLSIAATDFMEGTSCGKSSSSDTGVPVPMDKARMR